MSNFAHKIISFLNQRIKEEIIVTKVRQIFQKQGTMEVKFTGEGGSFLFQIAVWLRRCYCRFVKKYRLSVRR